MIILNKADILKELKNLDILILKKMPFHKDVLNSSQVPTISQMRIIEYILEHKNENVYQKDLEEVLGSTRATVSSILHTMEKNNLILRETNSCDTRTKKVVLTSNTLEAFQSRKRDFDLLSSKMTEGISDEELKMFLKIAEKMKNNLVK